MKFRTGFKTVCVSSSLLSFLPRNCCLLCATPTLCHSSPTGSGRDSCLVCSQTRPSLSWPKRAVVSQTKVLVCSLPVCLLLCLPVCLLICLSVCQSVCSYVCLSASLSAHMFVCLPVCLPVCYSVFSMSATIAQSVLHAPCSNHPPFLLPSTLPISLPPSPLTPHPLPLTWVPHSLQTLTS